MLWHFPEVMEWKFSLMMIVWHLLKRSIDVTLIATTQPHLADENVWLQLWCTLLPCMTREKQSVLQSVRVAMTLNAVDNDNFLAFLWNDKILAIFNHSWLTARCSSSSVHCYPFWISRLVHPCLQGWGGRSTLLCLQGKNTQNTEKPFCGQLHGYFTWCYAIARQE